MSIIPTLLKTLKTYLLLLVFIAISSYSYSQQSSLTVNAKSIENEPATGYFILTDNAIQDSTWRQELIDGTAYFPFYTVGIDDHIINNNIKIYPNPIGTSTDAQIVISEDFQLERITMLNALGQTIYIGETPITEFHVNTNKGLFFIQFQNNQGDINTLKLICNADALVFKLRTESGSAKKSTQANSYTLTFEDQLPEDPEYSEYQEQISIGEAEHQVLDITLDYSLKNILIQGKTNPDAEGTVKTSNKSLGSLVIESDGSIAQQTFQYAFSKTKTLPISIEIVDDNADQVVINKQAQHNQVIEIDTLLTYNYSLSGTACSPVGALVEIYDEGVLLGSDVINDASEYQIKWTAKSKSMDIDSVRVSMTGYIEENQTNLVLSAGNNISNFNLDQIKYQYQLSGTETSPIGTLVEVFDENQLLGSATVDAQGDYQIVWENTETNIIIDSIVFSADGYVSETVKNQSLSSGNNSLDANLDLVMYQYTLMGTETSPVGTLIEVYKDNQLLGSATVDGNGDYQINWESTSASMVIDSIIFASDGYVAEKYSDYSISSGSETLDASLEPITFQYQLSGTDCSPAGTLVKVYEEGILLGSAVVDANGDYLINWESVLSQMVIDSIVFTSSGYINKVHEDFMVSTGNNTLDATLVLLTYRISINGKALSLTKERITNKQDALVIERPDATKYYFDLDANGEFSGDIITSDTTEIVKAYWNTETMPEYREKTISLNKHNEPYPMNRIIAGYFDAYDQSGSAEMPVHVLNSDYLRVYAGKQDIVMNDTLLYALIGGASNQGSFNYWREVPLRPYVYTFTDDGDPVTADDIADMEHAVNEARQIFYHDETGWTVPVEETQTGDNFGTTPTGLWLMRQIPLGGYWNGAYGIVIDGIWQVGQIEGGEAQVDIPVSNFTSYLEAIGPWINDGIDGSNGYSSTWNTDDYHLTPLGNAHMTITTEFPYGTGKSDMLDFYLIGTDSKPAGTLVEMYRYGNLIQSGQVDENNEYNIHWTKIINVEEYDSIVFSHDGYQTQVYTDYTVSWGENYLNADLKEIFQYSVSGTQSSPVGTLVEVYEDGILLGSAGVDANGDYDIAWESTLTSLVIDSIIFSADGYESQAFYNYEVSVGENILEVNLPKQYNISLETYDGTLTNPVTEGVIEIKTLTDNQTHSYNIDSDGITELSITGAYQPDEQIEINIYNDDYSTGTFALLKNGKTAISGKISSRIGIYGYIQHECLSTLDVLTRPEGVYATMFADSLVNNTALMESLNDSYTNKGICFWSPKDAEGNLIETITLYNRTIDAEGNPISQDRINRQKDALDFIASQNNTGAGKTLYNTTYVQGTAPTDPNAHLIMKLDKLGNAGNVRLYTSLNEFRAASANTRDNDNPNKDITELLEGMGINDNSSGSNAFSVTVDSYSKIDGLSESGLIAWVTNFTYQPADFKK